VRSRPPPGWRLATGNLAALLPPCPTLRRLCRLALARLSSRANQSRRCPNQDPGVPSSRMAPALTLRILAPSVDGGETTSHDRAPSATRKRPIHESVTVQTVADVRGWRPGRIRVQPAANSSNLQRHSTRADGPVTVTAELPVLDHLQFRRRRQSAGCSRSPSGGRRRPVCRSRRAGCRARRKSVRGQYVCRNEPGALTQSRFVSAIADNLAPPWT